MFKKFFKIKNKGMTLVELLIVLSIFTILTSIAMFNYGNFRSSISTQNLANDIALSIRKSQSYAIGVRGLGDIFNYGHGVHFTTSSVTSNILAGSDKSFLLFMDVSPNGKYDYPSSGICGTPSSGNECEEILNINSADKISAMYLDGILKPQGGLLDIVFLRPNPDAYFCYRVNVLSSCQTNFSNAIIEVSNGKVGNDKVTKQIKIWNTGQISTN